MNKAFVMIIVFIAAILAVWLYFVADICNWDARMKRASSLEPHCFWKR